MEFTKTPLWVAYVGTGVAFACWGIFILLAIIHGFFSGYEEPNDGRSDRGPGGGNSLG